MSIFSYEESKITFLTVTDCTKTSE